MFRKGLFLTAMAICTLMMVPDDLWAGRRGGSRSFSRPSSSSRSSTRRSTRSSTRRKSGTASKKKSTWGSKKKATTSSTSNSKKSWGSKSKTTTTPRKQSVADKKLAAKAKKNGTKYKDRKSAVAAFKKKNATKYPSKFKSRPTTRPNYIPRTTMVNGRSVDIVWNPGLGGYAYMNALGTLVLYDVMADELARQRLMRQAGYWAPGMYAAHPVATTSVVHRHNGLGFVWFILICGIVTVAVITIFVVYRS